MRVDLGDNRRKRRPWWRLHLSSAAAGVLLLAGFAVAMLSAYIVDEQPVYGACWSHGWPWEFLQRWPRATMRGEWLDPWALTSDVKSFERAWLLADVAVGLFATSIVVAWLERRRRRGRLLQFTLAQGIAVTTIVAAGLGWYCLAGRTARREAALIRDFAPGQMCYFQIRHGTPSWFPGDSVRREPRAFDTVVGLEVSTYPNATLNLTPLHELSELKYVSFFDDKTADEHLSFLAVQDDLRFLTLRNAREVRGHGMKHLSGATRLEHFAWGGQHADDEDLKHLRNCRRLEHVELANAPLDGSGLAHLAGARDMKLLALQGTRVDDAALVHLAAFPKLELLFLHGTRVTDAGLPRLYGLQKLQKVALPSKSVTPEGVKALQEQLPNVQVFRK